MKVRIQYKDDGRLEWVTWAKAVQLRKQLSDWSLKHLIDLARTMIERRRYSC